MLIHIPEKKKFTWSEDGTDSFISYHFDDGKMILSHSEVPLAHRGRGIGRRMVVSMYEYLEEHNLEAYATCPFIRKVGKSDARWSKYVER